MVNNLGYKFIYYRKGTRLSTHFAQYSEIRLVYRTDAGSITANFNVTGIVSGTTYTDGFICDTSYYENDTYSLREFYSRYVVGPQRFSRYQIVGLNKNNQLVPLTVLTAGTNTTTTTTRTVTTQKIRPDVFFACTYSDNVAIYDVIDGIYLYRQYIGTNARYTFNTDLAANSLHYLKGTYDCTEDLFTLYQNNTGFVVSVPTNVTGLTLSDYFTEGYDYILLCKTNSTINYYTIPIEHRLYRFTDGKLVEYNNYRSNLISAATVINVTTGTGVHYLLGLNATSATIGTGTVHTNGGVYMDSGLLFSKSDENLKNFKGDVRCNFDELKSIPKKYFEWKDGEPKGNQIGTSAQAVVKYYPELVSVDDDGELGVSYDRLSIIALAAIDKLHERVLELEKEVDLLKKKLMYL